MRRILKFFKWYLIIALVAGGITSIYSCATETDEQKVTRKEKLAISEVDKNFSNELKRAIDKQNGDALVALYNNAKNDAQKSQIIDEINNSYMKWLGDIRNKSRLTIGLKDELLKYHTTLAFVEQINDPRLADLLLVRKNIGQIIQNQDMIDAVNKKYGTNVQVVKNPDQAQWLDVYIAKRVESAFNIKIGDLKLTDNYTDQYQITSYKSVLGTTVPTDNWEAIATFKKNSSVRQGVKRFYAVQISEGKFTKSGGFEVTLPIFIEVTKEDIDYSYNVKEYQVNQKNLTKAIYMAIDKYVPQKTEK